MRKLTVLLALLVLVPVLGAQQRPAITGIAFVRVQVADPAAAAQVYSHDMGFVRTTVGKTDFYSVSDSQWFEVQPLQGDPHAARLLAVAFTTRDLKGLEAYLQAQHQQILPQAEPHTFGVKDPEGNLIIFVQEGSGHPGARTPDPRATSHRIIHAGFLVRDSDREAKFYIGLLGFHPYWHGGRNAATTDWRSLQVPNGTDWLEFMLNAPATPDLKTLGVMDHFSLGVVNMETTIAKLAANQCKSAACGHPQLGLDGKMQLNLFDPDLTRIEYMEFKPLTAPCCSPFTGKMPGEVEDK